MFATTAASIVIGAHLHTFHIGSKGVPEAIRLSDNTPGLYLRHESGLTAGVVRNSLKRTSFYAGYTVETEDQRFALTLGAITGYQNRRERGAQFCPPDSKQFFPGLCEAQVGKTNAVLRPLIAPSISFPEARAYLLGAAPRIAVLGKAVSLSLEWGGQ